MQCTTCMLAFSMVLSCSTMLLISLLARVQGGLTALVDPFVGPVQFTKARLVGEELRTLPSKYHLPSLHWSVVAHRLVKMLLIDEPIDGVLPDGVIQLGGIEEGGGGRTVDHLLHPAWIVPAPGSPPHRSGGGGRHLGGTGLVVIDDGLDLLRLGHYLSDQHLYLAAGFMSLARQLTHLIGDHGESSTSFTGPGRLDGRIECQQVGLIRNALDGGHELVDGGCAGIELMDGCEAASRLIRDGMGAIGETGDGARVWAKS